MAQQGTYVYDWPRPMVTVDTVVFSEWKDGLHVLLIKRRNDPYKGHWVFPGGFLEMDEELADGAGRELREETGLYPVTIEQFHTFGGVGRDPRGRVITVAFVGTVPPEQTSQVRAGDDAAEARWFPVADLQVDLAFDHVDMLQRAHAYLLRSS